MEEKKYCADILLLNQATEELGIPVEFLKLTKEGIVLVHYPMIMLGDSLKELTPKDTTNIEHLISNLKGDICFIINPATPFKEKRNKLFSVRNNMASAFLNMVELKQYFPQLEVYMPEGIADIKPGIFCSYSKELGNGLSFIGKKYSPPALNDLADQIGINFMIKPLHSKNVYTHTIIQNVRQ